MKNLATLLTNMNSSSEAKKACELMFTDSELKIFELRIAIIKALLSGQSSHREIAANLGVSISKITAGSKAVQKANKATLEKFREVFNIKH